MVFNNKKDLLDLYNAIRGSHYTDCEDLEITTLEDVIYIGMKNDLSFLIDDVLNLYEHQSTYNPNMPIRGFLYLSDIYRKYIAERNSSLYSSKPILLPRPQYIVFYNCTKSMAEREELFLSKSFLGYIEGYEPCLEFKTIMLNINLGQNKNLMEHCAKLKQYAQFVDRIRTCQARDMTLAEAVSIAVDECINEGILAGFLSVHRAEVIEILLTEYDEQAHIASEKELSLQEGLEKGQLLMSQLYKLLLKDGRQEEYEKAIDDPNCRQELFRYYHLL